MIKLWNSVAFRLALVCGGLVVASTLVLSVVFYLSTVGVLMRDADTKIREISLRFAADAEQNGLQSLVGRIENMLGDGVDSDTEIYLLTDAAQRKLTGNIADWSDSSAPLDQLIDHSVVRGGRLSDARVILHHLSNGSTLIVGRDMNDLREIGQLIGHAILSGALMAVVLALGGTLIFRKQIERRIWTIRHAASEIEAGNLGRRIPISSDPDEFDRLAADINLMLDRIEQLMDGVHHVSNVIAHNLRTPLGRIRAHLDEELRDTGEPKRLIEAGHFAIGQIDGLIVVLDKLLQIAEAESGTRRQPFDMVSVMGMMTSLIELYDAAAEAKGATLVLDSSKNPVVLGDKDLLVCLLSNLLDNALKYAGDHARIELSVLEDSKKVTLIVQDNGSGIPETERPKVLQRFYRFHRNEEGSGLGLPIVAAITQLHGGTLQLEDAAPGLRVRIELPRFDPSTLPNGNKTLT